MTEIHWIIEPPGTSFDGLSVRARNCMKLLDITSWEQLSQWSKYSLLRIPELGRKTVQELTDALNERGMKLTTDYIARKRWQS